MRMRVMSESLRTLLESDPEALRLYEALRPRVRARVAGASVYSASELAVRARALMRARAQRGACRGGESMKPKKRRGKIPEAPQVASATEYTGLVPAFVDDAQQQSPPDERT